MTTETRTGLLAIGIVAGVFLLCGGGIAGLIVAKRGGIASGSSGSPGVQLPSLGAPSEKSDGIRWTNAELADHLRSKLGPVHVRQYRHGSLFVIQKELPNWPATDALWDSGVMRADSCYVNRTESAEEARNEFGRNGDPATMFAWGRFFFQGPADVITKIKNALTR